MSYRYISFFFGFGIITELITGTIQNNILALYVLRIVPSVKMLIFEIYSKISTNQKNRATKRKKTLSVFLNKSKDPIIFKSKYMHSM